ncbi:MAG TPA: carbohydrate-binding family 9-like protein [Phycisphaerae bacterium]|nr:carbohydrate-binding family 9-like protein [Phycisphaerae bacterium]
MLKSRKDILIKSIGAALLSGALLCALPGCKDSSNANAAADSQQNVSEPLVMNAVELTPDSTPMAGPLANPFWASTRWYTLNSASAGQDPAAVTRAAVAYDQSNLYIAYICTGTPPRFDPTAAPMNLWRHDCVEIWLDTSREQNGTNFFEIVVAPNGRTNAVWHSSATPPQPDPNGNLDLNHPYSVIPWKTTGLKTTAATGLWQGQSAWTLVVQIPLNSMPKPLQSIPAVGDRFRINLLRYQWMPGDAGQPDELTQYNLFPVPSEAQAVTPYLMGRLVLGSSDEGNLAIK